MTAFAGLRRESRTRKQLRQALAGAIARNGEATRARGLVEQSKKGWMDFYKLDGRIDERRGEFLQPKRARVAFERVKQLAVALGLTLAQRLRDGLFVWEELV